MASQFDVYLKMQMVGLFISPVFYGITVALLTGCLRLLARKRFKDFGRMRIVLILYDLFITGCSTVALIQDLLWMKKCESERFLSASASPNPTSQAKLISRVRVGGLPLVLAIWASTAFMTWRCLILGQRIKSRLAREGLNAILYLLTLSLIGSGVFHLFSPFQIGTMLSSAILITVTPSANIILALIIILHASMLQAEERSRKMSGIKNRFQYSNIAVLGVESSLMVVIASAIYAALYFDEASHGIEVVFRMLLPHICAISTLIIAHRVAKGNALTTTTSILNPSQIARVARTVTRRFDQTV